MMLAHKIALDPTNKQRTYFARGCGTARFSYNWALAEWERQYKAGGKPSQAALRRQLDYKARLYGAAVVVADRWFPSSKTCSCCGSAKAELDLSQRVFR